MTTGLPTVFTAAGLQPTPPATIQANLIAGIVAVAPGYTANLPGSLIEDVLDTEVAGISEIDQARVDAVNALNPFAANPFVLQQLGTQVYGVQLGRATNTSAYVVFDSDPPAPGFVITKGFVVTDGTYQYVVQDGGVLDSNGDGTPLLAVAVLPGSWTVAAGSITGLVTSIPSIGGSTSWLTVTNPNTGTPATVAETEEDYRAQVLQAGLAAATGFKTFLATLLGNVPGVQPRLVSVLQSGTSWEVLVGGSGDPYQIGYAVYFAVGASINSLTGSTLTAVSITNAANGVVTTNLNHGYATGQVVQVSGALGMTAINGTPLTVTVTGNKTFQTNVNTTALGTYTGGGVITPNLRNVVVTIQDYPDTYNIPFVQPPQQTVTMTVSWNTLGTNIISNSAVSQAAAPALAAYINSIVVGQPINLNAMASVFEAAVQDILPVGQLSVLSFAVSINGSGASPSPGTQVILGDPESYFYAQASGIVVSQA